jgi:hypothetical protein
LAQGLAHVSRARGGGPWVSLLLAFLLGAAILAASAPLSGATTKYALTLSKNGDGGGLVTSSPAGISCGSGCAHGFNPGTQVTLTAKPDTKSRFVGWSPCKGTGSCQVTMNAARTVVARFQKIRYALSVSKGGSGTGRVTGGGIDCGTACSKMYELETQVTLTASPGYHSTFDGWSGACSGTGSCHVTMSHTRSVTAHFTGHYKLHVARYGNGSGTVTSTPAGINCPSDCEQTYDGGTQVTLHPHPDSNSQVQSCNGCTSTMHQDLTVGVVFVKKHYYLQVSKSGSGKGTVTGGGISCGTTCSKMYDAGTAVTLTASPDSHSTFNGWSGACSGTGSCHVTMSNTRSVTAHFTGHYKLHVSTFGNGGGTVTSTPAGINCPSDCEQTYNAGTQVTLHPHPDSNSQVQSCNSCFFTMNGDRSVGVTFVKKRYSLQVAKTGSGTGTVTSSPAGIDCGTTCSKYYDAGTKVTLTATPGSHSTFDAWGGACTGTGTCQVTMSQIRSVTARFTAHYALHVARRGTGGGSVASSPAGISCGLGCSHTYDGGTGVTLTASPNLDSNFDGWSGAGCSGTGTCHVSMNSDQSVIAIFSRKQFTLTLTKTGSGKGTVTSSPDGISCATTCSSASHAYYAGTKVTLSASAAFASRFGSWSGGCTGSPCEVTMTGPRSVNVDFERITVGPR